MIWPFNLFGNKSAPQRGTIEAIYGMIVTQAREPLFYSDLKVPDTVDGRFDMVLLHLWMVIRALKGSEPTARDEALAQALFDHFCSDMDHNLREMGIGDMAVPKRMQKFGRAFYGRVAAYDAALAEGPEALANSINKNIYNEADIDQARRMVVYAATALEQLIDVDAAALESGWTFDAFKAPDAV